MSNQRAGTYKSSMSSHDHQDRKLVEFFDAAQAALEKNGNDDAAFYFEQVSDWMRSGRSIHDNIHKVLGL